ncbi:SGNH/GDSL hydrolase family protein [Biformimicrobium ophioploci]|uniref:Carbohydrate esterase 2 N-terminal domain-containing protein n=1 Tax=Biformimicrobium ophioploci TaxID=3036711 RepID=A0ABQ6LVP6_9GAMM|nr:SGNH/GDSL hydrolase family protein [Microbulbifer sp. NKW57]GMG86143.1 hypothetical protein MNKW57_04640 [Microbulbifer sp. NKW57]
MKNFLRTGSLLATLLFMVVATPASAITVSPDDSAIRYTGRWNFDNPLEPWIGWQGSTIEIQFKGTSISADLHPGNSHEYFRVILNGVPSEQLIRLESERATVTLASGLPANQSHHLVLMKETFYGSNSVFYGFDIADGVVQNLPPRPALRIEYFGDSNMDGTSLYSEKDQQGSDPLSSESGTYYAYPATVTRMLGAEMHLEAAGGATLAGAGDNTVKNFIYSPDWYNQDSSYRSGFNPHVIVVNAGANDISAIKGKRQKNKVIDRFRLVVSELRNVYGDTPHIVLYNAYGWDLGEPANYSHELVNEIGGNLSVFLYPWIWEQWHGSMVEHAGQARLLAEHIAGLGLGFSIVQPAEIFDGFGRNFNVANGSFEYAARTGFEAFGWRYVDDGVERIYDPAGAADGNYYIRLPVGDRVHQGTDATGDFQPGATSGGQAYVVRAMIRGTGTEPTAQIIADFEEQALYGRGNAQTQSFSVDGTWREYVATFTAPDGTWKTYITLKSAGGTVEFDDVRMSEY